MERVLSQRVAATSLSLTIKRERLLGEISDETQCGHSGRLLATEALNEGSPREG